MRRAPGWLLVALLAPACGAAGANVRVLSSGTISVRFDDEDETCGHEPEFEQSAEGCRVIDEQALMCPDFGVIDEVFVDGPCEAPARVRLSET